MIRQDGWCFTKNVFKYDAIYFRKKVFLIEDLKQSGVCFRYSKLLFRYRYDNEYMQRDYYFKRGKSYIGSFFLWNRTNYSTQSSLIGINEKVLFRKSCLFVKLCWVGELSVNPKLLLGWFYFKESLVVWQKRLALEFTKIANILLLRWMRFFWWSFRYFNFIKEDKSIEGKSNSCCVQLEP